MAGDVVNTTGATHAGLLSGRRLLITGVVTADSIAWATARAADRMGAEVVLTAPGRDLELARDTVGDTGMPLLSLDVTDEEDWTGLVEALGSDGGRLDGALHAIAWSPPDGLGGAFAGPAPSRLDLSFATSVSSYARLAGVVADLCGEDGASVVGLSFDSSRAWGIYNWMGVMKTALETANRYVARDLGPRGIRANIVSAGPLHTRAASGIPGFSTLIDSWERAPLGWDANDPDPVADVVCFLLSDLARSVTGQLIHVDGGHSAVQGADAPGG